MSQLNLLLRRPNLLQYPGTIPGFDSSHPAAVGVTNSVICIAPTGLAGPGNDLGFSDILHPKARWFYNAAPGGSIDGVLGPTISNGGAGNMRINLYNIPGLSITSHKCTIGQIIRVGAGNTFFSDLAANPGGVCLDRSSGILRFSKNNFATHISSGIAITAGVPYFFGVSSDDSIGVNFVVCNLNTGQIFSAFVADTTAITLAGSQFALGDNTQGGNIGANAAAMFATGNALSMPQLLQWAQDPWSFWYPQKFDFGTMLTPSQSTPIRTFGIRGLVSAECS